MKVLLVGGGGREHAIGWSLARDPAVTELISLPGNPGLAQLGPIIEGIAPTDVGAVAAVAVAQGVDLVVVGPEAPLAAGLVDALTARGVRVFGPTRAGARLESSKAYAKQIMDRAGAPTARWAAFDAEAPAIEHLRAADGPYVVKADGLAAGKGVLVTSDRTEAEAWVTNCMSGRFGDAGRTVVIEEYLSGPELSIFAICDGSSATLLEPARDYKRLLDRDLGPNTGGMGAYSPVADLPEGIMDFTATKVIEPVLATLAADGHRYVGFLYVGYVLTEAGPQVLEFNCRLGDPETQVVLPRLESSLVSLIDAALAGSLSSTQVTWSDQAAVNVVLAADGYPVAPRKGDRISGLAASDALIFHAGTTDEEGALVTAGGRVLSVVGRGPSVAAARRQAYDAVGAISFSNMQYRTDIAEET